MYLNMHAYAYVEFRNHIHVNWAYNSFTTELLLHSI